MDPAERTFRARLGAHTSWANTVDPASRTAKAREAAVGRFEKQVDPDGTMEPGERTRRAEHAKKAYFAQIALKSHTARRRRREHQGTPGRPEPA